MFILYFANIALVNVAFSELKMSAQNVCWFEQRSSLKLLLSIIIAQTNKASF